MSRTAVLAFSGGLDTTYCAVWLAEQGYDVHTVTVQTDNSAKEIAAVEARAKSLNVAKHVTIDARRELFDDYLRYLIYANALRGEVYPLCVSAERIAQAKLCALYAAEIGADALVHGSTGAGNDQVRFDVAFRVFAPDIEILTPIRDHALSREAETKYLAAHGVDVPTKTTVWSINRGLWGATIGGGTTHESTGELPEEAYLLTQGPDAWPKQAERLRIQFEAGVPVAVDGQACDPISLITQVEAHAGRHGIGRGMHLGDTILGIKGRVAFEAPAAVTLVTAHRELEKLVLSRQQLTWKRTLGDLYASGLHEARFFDPLMRDLEAFLASSQQRVTGEVDVRLFAGQAVVTGAASPFSLLNQDSARYGEQSAYWSGAEAAAFAKLYGMQDWLLNRAGQRQGGPHAGLD